MRLQRHLVFGVISAADSHVENFHSGWRPENWLVGVGERVDVPRKCGAGIAAPGAPIPGGKTN